MCETCFFLAKRGVDGTLAFRSPEPALDIRYRVLRRHYLHKLKKYDIKAMPKVQYGSITPNCINLTDKGTRVFLEGENIGVATSAIPNQTLGISLKVDILNLLKSEIV